MREGKAPRIFDDLLMMCQTERLETDTTRCEKTAKHTQRRAAIQTASHHPKHEKIPEFQGIPGFICGRGRRIRTLGTRFWSGCGKSMNGHTTACFPRGCAVCVFKTQSPKSFDDLLMILEILRPESEQFPTAQHGILERQEIISFEIVAWKSGCVKQEFLAQNLRR